MKNNFISFIIITILMTFFTSCNDKLVRYDGIYYHKEADYTSYLRFYEDGTIIMTSSVDTIPQIKKWFNKDHKCVSKGKYTILNDKINFQTICDVKVDYNGQIYKNKMILNVCSSNGNKKDNIKYLFKTW